MKFFQFLKNGITRRQLALSLGFLWLLDGLLQLQPQMFTSNFANQVLSMSAQGQPPLVAGPIQQVVKMVLANPAGYDLAFALMQIILAMLIFVPKTRRLGLAVSVAWALAVWYLGEGLGGLLGGQTSLLVGAPGAALLYAVLAIAAFPRSRAKKHAGDRPAAWLNLAWATIWLLGAVYQLLPGQNSPFNIASTITAAASGSPWWLGTINSHIAVAVSDSGLWLIVLLAAIQAAVGLGAFMPNYIRRLAIYTGIGLSLVFWYVGQNLGGFYTGLATDPSTGPLLVLMGLAVLGCGYLFAWPNDLG